MIKKLKISKLRKQIESICNEKKFKLSGNIRKCNIGNNNWTFSITTPNKCFLVKLIVPFGINNTGIFINSENYISATATLFGMKGLFGSINIPISREYRFDLPSTGFGLDANKCEKVFLIYPKCDYFYLREVDKKHHLTPFHVGLKVNDVHVHDGTSFKQLIENPDRTSKFADFGE